MAWIEPSDVVAVYSGSAVTVGLIAHMQGLAEIVIGEQDEPVSNGLKAVMVEIVRQAELAQNTDGTLSQEQLGSYSYTVANRQGLGLTKRAKRDLRNAVGKSQFWIQPLTRGDLETAPRMLDDTEDPLE